VYNNQVRGCSDRLLRILFYSNPVCQDTVENVRQFWTYIREKRGVAFPQRLDSYIEASTARANVTASLITSESSPMLHTEMYTDSYELSDEVLSLEGAESDEALKAVLRDE